MSEQGAVTPAELSLAVEHNRHELKMKICTGIVSVVQITCSAVPLGMMYLMCTAFGGMSTSINISMTFMLSMTISGAAVIVSILKHRSIKKLETENNTLRERNAFLEGALKSQGKIPHGKGRK